MMEVLEKNGFIFLICAIVIDFFTPYFLGIFYPNLNQYKDVMSMFGETGSPVRSQFLIISVIAGIFYLLSLPAIYLNFQSTSKSLAISTCLSIGLYGLGDCIFTGLFSISSSNNNWNLSTWIHNIGSGIGYAGFLLFPVSICLLYRKQHLIHTSNTYFVFFVVSIIFAIIYGLAQLPRLSNYILFSQLGFWQRVSFFFNYLPIAFFSIQNIKK